MDKITESYFVGGNTLYAIELNTIISKINEIIDNLKSSTGSSGNTPIVNPSSDPVTLDDIDERILDAIDELHQLIDEAQDSLDRRITIIENAPEGSTTEFDEEHLLLLFKQALQSGDGDELVNAVLLRIGVINLNQEPYFDVTVYQNINDLQTRVSSLELLPAKINLLVEEKNGQSIISRAAIIAAINNGTSTVGISADKIVLDGQTLSTKFAALDATVLNLNAGLITAENLDTITATVLDRLDTEDLEVHGTLKYNRAIGNVTTITSSTTLSDTIYYADVLNSNPYNELVLTFPSSPVPGQTIFIGGSRFYKIKASSYPIYYFYDYIEPAENYKHYLRGNTLNGLSESTAQGFGWNGIVEFIFTGTIWTQLIHNIILYN